MKSTCKGTTARGASCTYAAASRGYCKIHGRVTRHKPRARPRHRMRQDDFVSAMSSEARSKIDEINEAKAELVSLYRRAERDIDPERTDDELIDEALEWAKQHQPPGTLELVLKIERLRNEAVSSITGGPSREVIDLDDKSVASDSESVSGPFQRHDVIDVDAEPPGSSDAALEDQLDKQADSLMNCTGLSNSLQRKDAEKLAVFLNAGHTEESVKQLSKQQLCAVISKELIDTFAFSLCSKNVFDNSTKEQLVTYLHARYGGDRDKLEELTHEELCMVVGATRDPTTWTRSAFEWLKKLPWKQLGVILAGKMLANVLVATYTGEDAALYRFLDTLKSKGVPAPVTKAFRHFVDNLKWFGLLFVNAFDMVRLSTAWFKDFTPPLVSRWVDKAAKWGGNNRVTSTIANALGLVGLSYGLNATQNAAISGGKAVVNKSRQTFQAGKDYYNSNKDAAIERAYALGESARAKSAEAAWKAKEAAVAQGKQLASTAQRVAVEKGVAAKNAAGRAARAAAKKAADAAIAQGQNFMLTAKDTVTGLKAAGPTIIPSAVNAARGYVAEQRKEIENDLDKREFQRRMEAVKTLKKRS
eukprot:jgi/Mesvir1/26701/Mv20479-RA.1